MSPCDEKEKDNNTNECQNLWSSQIYNLPVHPRSCYQENQLIEHHCSCWLPVPIKYNNSYTQIHIFLIWILLTSKHKQICKHDIPHAHVEVSHLLISLVTVQAPLLHNQQTNNKNNSINNPSVEHQIKQSTRSNFM